MSLEIAPPSFSNHSRYGTTETPINAVTRRKIGERAILTHIGFSSRVTL
jgi:hypothetical protein